MSENTYTCELPRDVVSITIPKAKPHRRNWILLACRDKDFDLCSVVRDCDGEIRTLLSESGLPYGSLFDALGRIAFTRSRTWCLAFRSRHALKQAGLLAALQAGDVQLERQLRLAGKQAGVGRVCLSPGMTELDLRIGARKIKLLDWHNYHVSVEDYGLASEDVTAERCLQVFAEWINAYSVAGLSATRTSAAQVGWDALRRSLAQGSLFTSLDPEIRALERACYYGGRCEPFRLGEINGKCYLVDIRACYAALCAAAFVPTQPLRYWRDGCEVAQLSCIPGSIWAASCVVRTDSPNYPMRHHGKVIFPVGEFYTSLCGHELAAAAQAGHVQRVTRACSYVGLQALSGYARNYIESRAAMMDSATVRQLRGVKSVFNSSLGFLARQGREWSEWSTAGGPPWWFGVTNDPDDSSAICSAHTIDSQSELLRIGSEPRNASPIVHAAICSAARMALVHIFAIAGRGNYHYCDTDGLIVNEAGYGNLRAQPDLVGPLVGQLGVRHEALRCFINGQKNYKIGDHVVCAGLPAPQHSQWKKWLSPSAVTGIANAQGRVSPYTVECEDVGDETPRHVNTICGQ